MKKSGKKIYYQNGIMLRKDLTKQQKIHRHQPLIPLETERNIHLRECKLTYNKISFLLCSSHITFFFHVHKLCSHHNALPSASSGLSIRLLCTPVVTITVITMNALTSLLTSRILANPEIRGIWSSLRTGSHVK